MGEAKRKRRMPLSGEANGTYADKLTLDELASNDLEMAKDAVKNANRYHFGQDQRKALIFIRTCLDSTLRKLGIKVSPPSTKAQQAQYAKTLDRHMAEKQIRIEHRNRYRGADAWRCGLYIYQRDELVAFVSDVLTRHRTEYDRQTFQLTKEEIGFMVVTNADLNETKRIFVMPAAVKVAGGLLDAQGKPLQAGE